MGAGEGEKDGLAGLRSDMQTEVIKQLAMRGE
jgi:hypothetical protein